MMEKEIKLPRISEDADSGLVSEVYVKKGDYVENEQSIIAVESDKATVDVPVEIAGKVVKVNCEEGDEISVGDVILILDTESNGKQSNGEQEQKDQEEPEDTKSEDAAQDEQEDESEEKEQSESEQKETQETSSETDSSEAKSSKKEKKPAEDEKEEQGKDDTGEQEITKSGADIPAAPLAKKFARELGIDMEDLKTDDPQQRITREDVFDYAKKIINRDQGQQEGSGGSREEIRLPDFSKWGEIERKPMSGIRRVTAQKTTLSWQNIPHVTQMDEADITSLEDFRTNNKDDHLTMTAVLLKILGLALGEFPDFNTSIDLNSKEIIYKEFINVGVAVDTDDGLLIPVIRNVDKKSLAELGQELSEKSDKAREKDLTKEDMEGGNFVLSNLGAIGGTYFTPIIFPPQVAILGVSRMEVRPVFDGQEFRPRKVLPFSLSYDHRIVDGANGARFLRWICEVLEKPWNLLMGK